MEQNLAVLIDFENIAAGTDKEGLGRLDVAAIFRRLKVRGRIVVARSYADWGRFARFKQTLLEQGITMIELTSHGMQDKNRADIALVVDAMELAFTRDYVDTFVVVSGDSDFTPLVLRLKELNKRVIGVGTRGSTSKLLVQATDEFIFYNSLIKQERRQRPAQQRRSGGQRDRDKDRERDNNSAETMDREQAFALLVEAVEGVKQTTDGWVLASIIKSAVTRREPSFSEGDLGFSSFGRFLEAAHKKGVVAIRRDERSGGYRVDAAGDHEPGDAPSAPSSPPRRAQDPDLPELGQAAMLLRDLLAGEGLNPLSRSLRIGLVQQVITLSRERRSRRRRNSLQGLRSELVRNLRQDRDSLLTPNRVRAALRALREAGIFVHADGDPVRSESAPYTLKTDDPDAVIEAMDLTYLRALQTLGLEVAPDTQALAELLFDDPTQTRLVEERLAGISQEAEIPEDVEVAATDQEPTAARPGGEE